MGGRKTSGAFSRTIQFRASPELHESLQRDHDRRLLIVEVICATVAVGNLILVYISVTAGFIAAIVLAAAVAVFFGLCTGVVHFGRHRQRSAPDFDKECSLTFNEEGMTSDSDADLIPWSAVYGVEARPSYWSLYFDLKTRRGVVTVPAYAMDDELRGMIKRWSPVRIR